MYDVQIHVMLMLSSIENEWMMPFVSNDVGINLYDYITSNLLSSDARTNDPVLCYVFALCVGCGKLKHATRK